MNRKCPPRGKPGGLHYYNIEFSFTNKHVRGLFESLHTKRPCRGMQGLFAKGGVIKSKKGLAMVNQKRRKLETPYLPTNSTYSFQDSLMNFSMCNTSFPLLFFCGRLPLFKFFLS